ncbi:serine/threonine protein kinase [Herbidospora galbida]|uniref:non-specific serine/threonine protein kinase n=1 Tax=Herbidospora galbida TaxID=2575442 RepID=A0A4V5UXI1_9ACTN|nr:serine/threonine-protein kinase [Herbidospora galbida]TKK80943.1 serine/threonine protein kinase [Herbidospora galbida]
MTPETIGPYLLERRLGEGGMGVAYLAAAPGGRPVVVKVIRAELAGHPAIRLRFAREIEMARRMRSPSTPALVDADATAARPYLVTEYLPGPTLADAAPLPPQRLRQVATDVLRGLVEFHRAGIVHRDLKPDNIVLAPGGARVIDFGLARHLHDPVELTHPGVPPGTIHVMAPELWRGEAAGFAADVFAWGVAVAYAGTRRWPFSGTEQELRDAILGEPPQLDGLDPGLLALVTRALDKDPAARPTAEDLLRGLTRPGRRSRAVVRALTVAGLGLAAVAQCLVLGVLALPTGTPTYVTAAVSAGIWCSLLAIFWGVAPPGLAVRETPEDDPRWRVHLRVPALLQPVVAGVAVAAVTTVVSGWAYGLTLGLILGAAADRRVCARGRSPVELGPVPRSGRPAAFGLAAGSGVLAGLVTGHVIAGAVVFAGCSGVAAWRTVFGPSTGTPAARPSVRTDLLVTAIGALALALLAGNAAGTVRYVAGSLLTLDRLPRSGEMFDQFSAMCAEALPAVGLPLGLWYVLTGATARYLVATAWRAPGAVAEPRTRVLSWVPALVLLPHLAVALPPSDPCDDYLGRRQRSSHLGTDGRLERFSTPVTIETGGARAEFSLRWTDEPGCAWALVTSSGRPALIWLERAAERLGERSALGLSHTESHPFAGGRVRACAEIAGRRDCTAWVP